MSGDNSKVTEELSFTDGKYSVALTDKNKMLAKYDFTSADKNVTVSKNGDKLTITAAAGFDDKILITASRNNLPTMTETSRLLDYGDPEFQDVIVGADNMETVKAHRLIDSYTTDENGKFTTICCLNLAI